ncbi:MAG: glycoside hydrolase family 13 protein [Candidatus Limiplasma sp.]|nr:glycoside hydrolase family 13 protein [Candidatus Limiplasma sp.]
MIQREAILHIPLSQYAFAQAVGRLTIRLRAARGNLDSCRLFYGDRARSGGEARVFQLPMPLIASEEGHDYFEGEILADFDRIYYYFQLQAGDEALYYYAGLFSRELPRRLENGALSPALSEYYQYPVILRTELAAVPQWLREAVVYQIFPDSFATDKERLEEEARAIPLAQGHVSRSRLGGTLEGIRRNLGYIQGLGANCLYLNPIFTAKAYHKYDTLDYFHIDPCLGTEADFDALVEEAHSRGMRILLDGVFNHCSSDFFAFRDVVEKGPASPYADWFYHVEYPVRVPQNPREAPNYACFAYVGEMPKLDTANPQVQAYFAKVGRYWVQERHIDGWRLDVANEVARDFWRLYRREVLAANPQAALIGEVWENAETWLRGDAFDSTMNYDFLRHCRDFFAAEALDAAAFDSRVTQMRLRYPTPFVLGQMNLLDSHDVPRFLTLCGEDRRKHKLAVLFQMLCPGVPSVYYGDEQALTGSVEEEYRAAMPWSRRDADYEAFFRQALALRKSPAVLTGDYRTLCAQEGSRLYAFSRSCPGHTLTAYLNAGSEAVPVAPPQGSPALSSGWKDGALEGYGYLVVRSGGETL